MLRIDRVRLDGQILQKSNRYRIELSIDVIDKEGETAACQENFDEDFLGSPQLSAILHIEPVTEHEIYTSKVVRHIGEAVLIDFGQNIAGVCRIKLPEN